MSDAANLQSWSRYCEYLCAPEGLGVTVDPGRIPFDEAYLEKMAGPIRDAFRHMDELEAGAIANPDEKRQVGHYWLRNPDLVDSKDPELAEIGKTVQATLADIRSFSQDVLAARVRPPRAERFTSLLLIGIGGSALGPQLVADALVDRPGKGQPGLVTHFIDNTDPDGIERTFQEIEAGEGGLDATLVVVVSKSGGTPETRNGLRETQALFRRRQLTFASQAVAITREGSQLHEEATRSVDAWLRFFPMWDWVGGRTSETSAVGLLPAALAGVDIDALLDGARQMDEATRVHDARQNPAALLALMWYHQGGESGDGSRDMVILPYKDRLLLMSRYLQQLVMESLGKKENLRGEVVHQGLVVYGNKGSTDQHAFIQQLRDGTPNFFATFIQVLEDGGSGSPIEVEAGVTSGDFLLGFLLGTREAFSEAGRGSITITIPRVDAENLGKLIALYERAVGLYAWLIGVNAYHQPGVQAGKVAANDILEVQKLVLEDLAAHSGKRRAAPEIAGSIGRPELAVTVFKILERLAVNPEPHGVQAESGKKPFDARFGL